MEGHRKKAKYLLDEEELGEQCVHSSIMLGKQLSRDDSDKLYIFHAAALKQGKGTTKTPSEVTAPSSVAQGLCCLLD